MEHKHSIWGKHPELPLYVSIDGEIRRSEKAHYTEAWYRYSPHITSGGYTRITMSYNDRKYCHPLHRLVTETFITYPIPKELQVDHVDNVKTNSCLENLQLLTPSENTLKSAMIGERNGRATISLETAQSIWDDGEAYWDEKFKEYRKPYSSIIAEKYGVTRKVAYKILNRITWAQVDRSNICGR